MPFLGTTTSTQLRPQFGIEKNVFLVVISAARSYKLPIDAQAICRPPHIVLQHDLLSLAGMIAKGLNSVVSQSTDEVVILNPDLLSGSSSNYVNIEVVNGVMEGPVLMVCAAIHGDELNGVEVVRQLLAKIDPDRKSVV